MEHTGCLKESLFIGSYFFYINSDIRTNVQIQVLGLHDVCVNTELAESAIISFKAILCHKNKFLYKEKKAYGARRLGH